MYICVCMSVNDGACVNVCVHMCVCICVCVHMCVCAYVCAVREGEEGKRKWQSGLSRE